jgi:hypothetical protein
MRLADKFKVLSPSQNNEVVEYIQVCCPTAFKEQDEKVQIVVDNMDIITFKQIMEYCIVYLERLKRFRNRERRDRNR